MKNNPAVLNTIWFANLALVTYGLILVGWTDHQGRGIAYVVICGVLLAYAHRRLAAIARDRAVLADRQRAGEIFQ